MLLFAPDGREYPYLWGSILSFYFRYVRQFGRIHPDFSSGALFEKLEHVELPFEVPLDAKFAREFNDAYDRLKSDIACRLREPNFEHILIGSFVVRALQCAVVWIFGWQAGLVTGLLQFVVAPLSLTSSFIRLFTNLSDCILHYAFNAVTAVVCARALSSSTWKMSLIMDVRFVTLFFCLDFGLNMFVYMRTAERWSVSRLLKHMAYGTFNTKTYFVIVFGCLYGLEVDLVVLVATSLLTWFCAKTGLQRTLVKAVGWPCFPVVFYVEHRIGHMPRVYPHAHKMHHYLHDSTAFDAHIYGSGMNEEFFWILAETLPCLAFPGLLFPYFLNGVTLHSSWTNKGAHSRTAESVSDDTVGCFDADNFHADHHTWHRANFSSSSAPLIDFYFGTECPGLRGSRGRLYELCSNPDENVMKLKLSTAGTISCRVPSTPESVPSEKHAAEQDTLAADRVISRLELEGKRLPKDGGPWVAVHGGVFDLSTFQKIHPGGAEVLRMYAGSDATKEFSEVGHSAKAKAMAGRRLIGLLEGQEPSDFVLELLASPTS
eukprot:TRINITY_DN26269_c1_g2_i1.p1 TRINITY_DN26269_c1_g2~~TRINITY_DN26269_c1_g2_i1.p1  ORF type:complete len:545 (+),score=82.84 TRINITY_DN26269_c1_g2_i1:63-1697(+)